MLLIEDLLVAAIADRCVALAVAAIERSSRPIRQIFNDNHQHASYVTANQHGQLNKKCLQDNMFVAFAPAIIELACMVLRGRRAAGRGGWGG